MKAAFRVDASMQIGSGHVMRCLTLAEALRANGAQCYFISRAHPGNLLELIRKSGFAVSPLPVKLPLPPAKTKDAHVHPQELATVPWLCYDWQTDAEETIKAAEQLFSERVDWIVVDHYQLDAAWERKLRPYTDKLMVIDDLANRPHDCDLLLDQNYYQNFVQRYKGLVPEKCLNLLGPKYILLRPEFTDARQKLRARDGMVRRLLVFFGGSDPTNQTQKVLEALKRLTRSDIGVDVVVGSTNPHQSSIKNLCEELHNVSFHCQVSNMAELILNADLGIGAGGSAMWERCYLGLPTITAVFAKNQERTTEDVGFIGAIEYLGWSDRLTSDDYVRSIIAMLGDPLRVKQMSKAALGVLPPRDTTLAKVMQRLIWNKNNHNPESVI